MININLVGGDKLRKALKAKEAALTKKVDAEMQRSMVEINAQQKALAPVDFGLLRSSLKFTKTAPLEYEIVSSGAGSEYAPYQEFGTGGLVSIPKGLENEAAKYKGGIGGNFKDFVESMKDWCRKKGIPESAAYPIAVNIIKNGLRPQPFFFAPAFKEFKELRKRVQALLGK